MEGSLFMRASKEQGLQLVLRIVGALALFFALDAALFRSSLYLQILSPESIVGTASWYLRYERQREPSHRKDVLVIGDSQVGEGFWAGLANKSATQSELYFVQGGIPGATLRVLYFYQKILDPNRDRYKAIVICLPTYRITSSTEAEHLNDRMLDADFLLPVLSSPEYLDFSRTYTTGAKRMEVGSKAVVQGLSYKLDFQNLVFHPVARKRLVAWRRWIKDRVAVDYAGRDESMLGLRYDSRSGDIQFPERLTEVERAQVTDYLTHPGTVDADHFDEYSRQWIEKFIDRYRGSQTTLVFVRFPSEVLPQPDSIRRNGPSASFMSLLRNTPGIQVIDEGAFYDLEDPRYFFDTLHMNAEGRRLFTIQLADRLAKTL